jgi:hypothetical protein
MCLTRTDERKYTQMDWENLRFFLLAFFKHYKKIHLKWQPTSMIHVVEKGGTFLQFFIFSHQIKFNKGPKGPA